MTSGPTGTHIMSAILTKGSGNKDTVVEDRKHEQDFNKVVNKNNVGSNGNTDPPTNEEDNARNIDDEKESQDLLKDETDHELLQQKEQNGGSIESQDGAVFGKKWKDTDNIDRKTNDDDVNKHDNDVRAEQPVKIKYKNESQHLKLETEKIKQIFHWNSEDTEKKKKDGIWHPFLQWLIPKDREEELQRVSNTQRDKIHVVLFKTHRTGGSTVQNILMRYGDQHNLIFALPKVGHDFYVFDKSKVLQVPGHQYNILCHSMKYNSEKLHNFMPLSSRYITVLRNPVEVYESAFQYYDFAKCFSINPLMKNALYEFLKNPEKYYRKVPHCGVSTKNPTLFDFGVSVPDLTNNEIIQEKINEISQDFHLVMIADYMDESLILLKHLLGLNMEDIVYFSHNVRSEKVHYSMSTDVRLALGRWNRGDVLLYNHFFKEFLLQIKEFGSERLEQERDEFLRVRDNWSEYCLKGEMLGGEMREGHDDARPRDVNAYGFVLSERGKRSDVCHRLVREEEPYTQYLYTKMQAMSPGHRSDEF